MDRTQLIKAQMESEHYRYRSSNRKMPDGCVRITGCQIVEKFSPSSVFAIARRQFLHFLETCLGLSHSDCGTVWQFALNPSFDKPGFLVVVSEGTIQIQARSERDLTDAMHYLEREMIDLGGPWLPLGRLEKHPSLTTRFTESIFIPGHQSLENLGGFSSEYLGLMRHFGANAMKLGVNLKDYWQSSTLPELNAPNLEASLAGLRAHARHLGDHGMDLFLILNLGAFPSTHAIFEAYPEILGAREEIFLEELSGADRCLLCSSHPMVIKAYREVIENLFHQLPELAGGIMLVGGEGFHHCFMRPANPDLSATNCPRCRGQDPHKNVAALVNTVASAVKAENPANRLLAWPYSAFIWSKDDATDSRWIRHVSSAVEVLSNIDCGDPDPTTNSGAYLFDYNIKIPGPSTRFAAQAKVCTERDLAILAKTETNTTPDTFFLPYLPVHFRWYERNRAIRESGCSGFVGQWRFYGANGSLPEELQYHAVWNPDRTAENLLETVARRDFGLDSFQANRLVEAWRTLSRSWDDFPYSAMTSGEREAYMRGPWYLGPAHPLIFNSQSGYNLGPKFFRRRGDLVEAMGDKEIARLPGKPRYVCDLLLCLPFGVDSYLEHTKRCRDRWDEGLAEMEAIFDISASPALESELNVCQTISIHLHSLFNTVEFLNERELLNRQPHSSADFAKALQKLDQILNREIQNSRRALPVLKSDPRIGYGHAYGEVYDHEMVEEKIAQCEFVRQKELPRIGSVVRFHIWNQYP